MRDANGHITEGSSYNVFVVDGGSLRTPTTKSALRGISRDVVLDLARGLDIETRVEDLQPYDILTADECFFASTSWCMVPVTYVDKRQIGNGEPGPVTRQLLTAWGEAVGVDIVDQATRFGRALTV